MSRRGVFPVMPAQAGIQFFDRTFLDSRLRGNDKL